MALQMAVGRMDVDLVADMNDDKQVTSFDAAEIMIIAAGEAASAKSWLSSGAGESLE